MLSLTEPGEAAALHAAAYGVKARYVGRVSYYRGLIEFSNICARDCVYCGIRRSNAGVRRFETAKEDIVASARWAYDNRFGSVTLQSGERSDEAFVEFVCGLISEIKSIGGGALGLTLSLGEQTAETYRRWFALGAHRYLLRVETSNEELYKTLHPDDGPDGFKRRVECLSLLRDAGYQVGTGVMVGLPGQTYGDLADDILFFERVDAAMIGMGPYVAHGGTPLGRRAIDAGLDTDEEKRKRLTLGLNMIAATRLYLRDVNIAAATALSALLPNGRELGLKAGANVLMPLVSPPEHRADYQLYEGKPGLADDAAKNAREIARQIERAGDVPGLGKWGDSPHFANRAGR